MGQTVFSVKNLCSLVIVDTLLEILPLRSPSLRSFFDAPEKFSIHRFLPVELSLTIKGNTLLDVYDIITVNTLPDFMKKRVMFQIMGIENSVSSENWTTTYKCVMRFLGPSANLKTIENL